MLNLIDPNDSLIDYGLFREHCILKQNYYIKDLRIIRNRSLKNIAILDNTITAFKNQMDNGIHIPTFIGQKNDTELLKLIPLLKYLASSEDIQADIKERIGLSKLFEVFMSKTN